MTETAPPSPEGDRATGSSNGSQTSPPQPVWYSGAAVLGIVYGDIGTSPLYALRESFHGTNPIDPTPANVLGILSLIFWSLVIVISLKYLLVVMRVDNRGEGGIIALTALLKVQGPANGLRSNYMMLFGLFGAALLYGDGTITPAISVLSAVEGLVVAAPVFTPYIVPITIVILVALFAFQKRGTARVGSVFGPVMLAWFVAIGALGIRGIVTQPDVFMALNPIYGARFFAANGISGYLVLGSVFLVVTGGEVLYAAMGHFGRQRISAAWFAVVFPALLLNYFGQGALVLSSGADVTHPFYHLAPAWAIYPLVGLATAATVIASQAVISGVFSLTRQAIALGDLPRLNIVHTSSEEVGQIYIPTVNWLLLAACIGLVVTFGTSSALADAYGVAVSTDMVITTILVLIVTRARQSSHPAVNAMLLGILLVDVAFFSANIFKIPQGGWYALAVGALMFVIMTTWRRGRLLVAMRMRGRSEGLHQFLERIESQPPVRVDGCAVFLTATLHGLPLTLQHHLRHNRVLHRKVVLVTVDTADAPRVPATERVDIHDFGGGIQSVRLHYGFMQTPNVPVALRLAGRAGLDVDLEATTYYVGRTTLLPSADVPGMMLWRERLFAFLSRNGTPRTIFYQIPPEQVVELGIEIEI
jgi:KUP system potassium uptake protein